MSNERTTSTGKVITDEMKAAANIRAAKKARFLKLADRGYLNDRLHITLPPDVYGEWVHNSEMDISRMKEFDFEVDTKYAKSHALHSEADGKTIVGDVIFMTTSMENHELLEEIRKERYLETHVRKQAEDSDLRSNLASVGSGVTDESESELKPFVREVNPTE